MRLSWNRQQDFKFLLAGKQISWGRSNFHIACLCCLDDKYCGICQRVFKARLHLNNFTTLVPVLKDKSQKLYRWGRMETKTFNKTFITLTEYSRMAVMSHPDVLSCDLQPVLRIIIRNFILACWGQKQDHTVILRVIHQVFDPSVDAPNSQRWGSAISGKL